MVSEDWRQAAEAVAAARAIVAAAAAPAPPKAQFTEEELAVLTRIDDNVGTFVDTLFAAFGDKMEAAIAVAKTQEQHWMVASPTEGEFETIAGKVRVDETPDGILWHFSTLLSAGTKLSWVPPVWLVVTSKKFWWFEFNSNQTDSGFTARMFGLGEDGEHYVDVHARPTQESAEVAQGCMAGWLILCGLL